MYTELGKFLRHLRIENKENLKMMATKLEISSAFLSALENGKKSMSDKLKEKLIEVYKLNETMIIELDEAIYITNQNVSINLIDSSLEKQKLGILFARSFNDLDENKLARIRSILKGDDKKCK